MVARGTKTRSFFRSYTDGSGWADWSDLGGHLTYGPAITSSDPKQRQHRPTKGSAVPGVA
ncbi:hypothetical protein RKD26_006657 [Streptomyces calvus]|uniref:hypothetical protein n=1 Tax=Streptomyces calvus TaxID=67282 RepID=UPI0035168157